LIFAGKTLSFLFPAIVHIINKQKRLQTLDEEPESSQFQSTRPAGSPLVLILAPTRELATQIHKVAEFLASSLQIHALNLIGGPSLEGQSELLKAPVELITATPGRLTKLIAASAVKLGECSFFVLDEADRMLDLGFDDSLQQIVGQLPAKRQSLLFSATWPLHVQQLAAKLTRPEKTVRVVIGNLDLSAARSVQQVVEVIDRKAGRREKRLLELLALYHSTRSNLILIFVLYKREAEQLSDFLGRKGYKSSYISGEKSQAQRRAAIERFRSGDVPILVATDIAARGLDIRNVTHVINFSLGLSIEHYVHRIGRTGRAGNTGVAHTFVVDYDLGNVPALVKLLKQNGQEISKELAELEQRAIRKREKHSDAQELHGDALFQAKKQGKIEKNSNFISKASGNSSDSDSLDEEKIFGADAREIVLKGKKQSSGQQKARNKQQKGGRRH
jgi:ATP-dependent RNA helicase DBP3